LAGNRNRKKERKKVILPDLRGMYINVNEMAKDLYLDLKEREGSR
jgi:hypothetical protein